LFSLLDDALHRLRGVNGGLSALILPRDEASLRNRVQHPVCFSLLFVRWQAAVALGSLSVGDEA